MNIIHISDLHFGNEPNDTYKTSDLKRAFLEFIKKLDIDNLILVISGDITLKGKKQGFNNARGFFDDIIKQSNLDRKNIIVCPGNHDICKNESENPTFESFKEFSYFLRKDNVFDFTRENFVLFEIKDICFLVVNSAYHLNHQFGLVHDDICDFIKQNKAQIENSMYKIAVVHHHLLNQFESDISTIRNSYPFLYALDEAGFNLILHGHQHTYQSMPIGNSKMLIKAARSFNFPEKGYQNGVNHYVLENGSLKQDDIYEFTQDIKTQLTLTRVLK
jgi:3',5'-cyclic AMP phosphodiesterase CpdA